MEMDVAYTQCGRVPLTAFDVARVEVARVKLAVWQCACVGDRGTAEAAAELEIRERDIEAARGRTHQCRNVVQPDGRQLLKEVVRIVRVGDIAPSQHR